MACMGRWKLGGAAVAFAGCTIPNPAFDQEGGAPLPTTTEVGASTGGMRGSESGPSESSVADTSHGVTSSASADGTSTSTSTSTSGATSESTDTGPDDPMPPEIGPFGEPELVLFINDAEHEDDDPTLPDDMLDLYFASRRGGGMGNDDIWVAHRDDELDPWGEPMAVAGINTEFRENTPEISDDGLIMYFASDRLLPGGDEDIYMVERGARSDAWGMPVRVNGLSTPERDVCPFLTLDGLHAYACMGPTVELDLVWFMRPTTNDAWSAPMPVMPAKELSAAAIDCGPWLDPSAQVLVFMSNRVVANDTDLYHTRRSSIVEPFDPPQPIEGVNSLFADDDPWVSPNGETLFFASSRSGLTDIYVAHAL